MLEGCRRGVSGWVAWRLLLPALVAAPILANGCSDDVTRPGLASDCNDPECIEARGNGVPSTPPSSMSPGSAGAAGAAGGGGMPDPGAGTLSGSVLEITTADLIRTGNLQGNVEVRAPSADTRATRPLVTEPAADGTYRLDGVQVGEAVWVGVGSFANPPNGTFIDTLQAVNSSRSGLVNLLVVRRQVMIDVASASFLNNPIELDPTLAQVVVRFVDENGLALEGVQIQLPAADQVPTAYDAGDIYSDALDATSTRGMAVLANLPAPAYPGGPTSIVAVLDGTPFTTEIQVASGAVTLVSAVVPVP
jgi:hypothetical protein